MGLFLMGMVGLASYLGFIEGDPPKSKRSGWTISQESVASVGWAKRSTSIAWLDRDGYPDWQRSLEHIHPFYDWIPDAECYLRNNSPFKRIPSGCDL